ncbi:MAG: hypothetical protein GXO19_07650 [Epsilonproteobacteria bacterium]|nr:hypothetical protein [Campylobacterota bacterium]NPA57584.1 hypothetical protein [Campylobacterota bacterium]
MFSGVSLDQAPPFEAPLIFFITAPLFAIIGAILLIIGAGGFGVLHSFTIGFLTLVMIGALQQMLPVVVGVRFKYPKALSYTLIVPLVIGVIAIVAALGFGHADSVSVAGILLLLSLWFFSLITIAKLLKAPRKSDSVIAMILSLLSLLFATILGVHLLISLILGNELNFLAAHGAFAAFGWVGLLIIGVSYQVIPMFYVTEELSPLFKQTLAPAIFGSIVFYTVTEDKLFFWIINVLFLSFALISLLRMKERQRKLKEPSVAFWQSALILLIAAAIYSFIDQDERYAVAFGYGFAATVVYGMLYKIIPFLVWFHLSSRGFLGIPTMKEMVNEDFIWLHLYIHLSAIFFLFTVPKLGAYITIVENLLFLWTMRDPIKLYFDYRDRPSPLDHLQGR